MILSVAMMLRESFNETEGAELIENAVDKTLNQGILTRDLGGQASTAEMTAAIISSILALRLQKRQSEEEKRLSCLTLQTPL